MKGVGGLNEKTPQFLFVRSVFSYILTLETLQTSEKVFIKEK